MPRHRQFLHGLVYSLLLASSAAAAEPGVRWMQDIESAKAIARQTGRLVLVHFWTPECVPCRTLEMSVFNQPGVAGALESQFVTVKLNANENPATAQGLGITHVPTDVVLTPEGQVVGMLVSPATPTAYVAEVTQVARQFASRSGAAYQNAVAAAPQTPQLNAAYANLQFSAPPQAAGPTPQSVAAPGAFGSAGNGSPYSWAVAGSQAAAGMPVSAPTMTTSPPSGYTTPYQAPPAAADAAANRPSGSQVWPGTSIAPSTTAATAPMAVPNPYTQAPPRLPSQMADRYAAPAASNLVAAAPAAPSPPVAAAQPSSSAAPTPPPDARRLPPGVPPLGFDGYCPVSMRNLWKWMPGDPRWGAIHRGRTYWFAGQREQQQFLANPDYYSPVLSGIDPVLALDHRQMVPGLREHALDYDNQFYLFSSEATLQQFTANPERYAEEVRQAMGTAPQHVVR